MAVLLGPDGLPIQRQMLTTPQAEPSVTGTRTVWTEPVASGLTPARLASLLRSADDGDFHDFMVLADEIEERELQYATVLSTRRRALSEIEPTVIAASEEKSDQKIADAVRDLIAQPEFTNAVEDLTDAFGKGYAVVEIIWNTEGNLWRPADYLWREPWFFQVDRATGKEVRLRNASAEGEPLNPYCFMVHLPRLKTGKPWRGGLARLAVWAFMLKGFTLKDWMVFLEVYGMPIRLGKYGRGATAEEKATLLRAVRDIAGDAAAIVPEGMSIELIETKGSSSSDAFERLCRYMDEQISKIVLGQTTTTDAISGGHAVSREHNEVRRDIQKSDARKLAATVNRDLIQPFVSFNFGPQERYPRVALPVEEPEDLNSLMTNTERFVRMGGKVSASVVRDRLGYEDPGDDEELLTPPAAAPGADIGGELARALSRSPSRARREDGGPGSLAGASDAIDSLLEEISDGEWEAVARPLVEPLRQAAGEAQSFGDLLDRLKRRGPDGTRLAERLAELTAIARGLGDAGS